MQVQLDVLGGIDVGGWQLAFCHDSNTEIVSVDAGIDTLTAKNGDPPDFLEIDLLPGQGWTTGVVICFGGCAVLSPGFGYQLYDATYEVLALGVSIVCPCDGLNMINSRLAVGCVASTSAVTGSPMLRRGPTRGRISRAM